MRSIVALVSLLGSVACSAETIHAYKAVHADGTVSYSDTRPGTASSIETLSIPQSDASISEQGEQRKQQMQSAGKQLDEQRATQAEARREYESRLAEARKEVRDAERVLDDTVNSKKNATAERVAIAEERLAIARKKLREVERAGP